MNGKLMHPPPIQVHLLVTPHPSTASWELCVVLLFSATDVGEIVGDRQIAGMLHTDTGCFDVRLYTPGSNLTGSTLCCVGLQQLK